MPYRKPYYYTFTPVYNEEEVKAISDKWGKNYPPERIKGAYSSALAYIQLEKSEKNQKKIRITLSTFSEKAGFPRAGKMFLEAGWIKLDEDGSVIVIFGKECLTRHGQDREKERMKKKNQRAGKKSSPGQQREMSPQHPSIKEIPIGISTEDGGFADAAATSASEITGAASAPVKDEERPLTPEEIAKIFEEMKQE